MKKYIQLSILAIFLVAGFSLINGLTAQALTIADQNGIPSACPHKYPNNTKDCTVFINSITVNGFVDNDTSYTARITPVPYGHLIPGQTITISWTDNTDGWNDSYGTSINNYLVKYGCGDTIDLSNDSYTISAPIGRKYVTWTVPSSVSNYQYCKIWVYAQGIKQSDQPTLGVSNTRAFTIQPPITRYTCNSNYQCVVATNGEYTSLTSCQNNCVAPVRYNCNTSNWTCSQAANGTYANYSDCTAACQPPITRYTCNSNYQCVVATNGEYTSLTSCQNNCVAPVRYNCNTSNWTCSQAANGTYANYSDCTAACQPPITRYTCNSNYQCVVATNGEYSSYSNCLSGCVAYNQCTITNFTSNDYSIATGDNIVLTWNTSNCNSCTAYTNPSNSYWTGSQSTYGSRTIYNLQSPSTFTLTCSNNTTSDTETLNVNLQSVTPTLSFWADKYSLTQGETTYLRWTSNNTRYCVASNGWSGTKATSNYESIAPTSQTTYTLTCYGNGGQISQTITLYVASPTTSMSFTKLGRNLSNGDRTYAKVIRVSQGDVIEFYLTISAGSNNDLYNVILTDPLPSVLSYKAGTTKINGVVQADTIATTGLSLGTISRGTSKTITFQALSNNPGTYLTYTNTAQATASGINTVSDSATITYGLVAGAATVATGAEDSLVISIMLSIGLAILLWYYLKFNPQGKIVLARLENKVREYRLAYLRHRMKK